MPALQEARRSIRNWCKKKKLMCHCILVDSVIRKMELTQLQWKKYTYIQFSTVLTSDQTWFSLNKRLIWRPEILSDRQVFSWKSRTPYCGVSQQTNLQAAISDFCTYCLQCDYALNHFIVVKYWSLSWNEIISCGPSSEELGRLGLSQGICPGWLWRVYIHTLWWLHMLANPKPVSGGCSGWIH